MQLRTRVERDVFFRLFSQEISNLKLHCSLRNSANRACWALFSQLRTEIFVFLSTPRAGEGSSVWCSGPTFDTNGTTAQSELIWNQPNLASDFAMDSAYAVSTETMATTRGGKLGTSRSTSLERKSCFKLGITSPPVNVELLPGNQAVSHTDFSCPK